MKFASIASICILLGGLVGVTPASAERLEYVDVGGSEQPAEYEEARAPVPPPPPPVEYVDARASAPASYNSFIRVGISRGKLVDKGTVAVGGVVNPADAYKTNPYWTETISAGHFVHRNVAIEASVSMPATTHNLPAGALAGAPNLGDDQFVQLNVSGTLHPLRGRRISPYVGGGIAFQFTRQQRDVFARNLNVSNSHGPMIQAGIDFNLTDRLGLYVDAKKAFYNAIGTGDLPLGGTFAPVVAKAELDPLTLQIGATVRFGQSKGRSEGGNGPIEASDRKWFLRGGVSQISLADKVKLNVGGAPFPGAGLTTNEHFTPSVQIGRRITNNISVVAIGGLPPTINVFGAGSIGFPSRLGKATYGPVGVTVQYSLKNTGVIRPYVGIGGSYMIVFKTKDGVFQDLKLSNDLAPAFDFGSDFMFSKNHGVFIDVKRAYLRPTASGKFQIPGGPLADVKGKVRLDPWVISTGLTLKF